MSRRIYFHLSMSKEGLEQQSHSGVISAYGGKTCKDMFVYQVRRAAERLWDEYFEDRAERCSKCGEVKP